VFIFHDTLHVVVRKTRRSQTMSAVAQPIPEPAGESSTAVSPLFRQSAMARAGHQLPGPVSVIAPPALFYTLAAALASLGLLATALYLIEVPLRARAVGMLMPPGGILDIASSSQGRIMDIAVSEGDLVAAGQLLVALSSDLGSENVPSLATSQFKSIESELSFLSRRQRESDRLYRDASDDVELRLVTMHSRRNVALREVEVFTQRLALLASRVRRLEDLEIKGGIPPDRLEQLRSEFLSAQRDQLAAERGIIELDLEMQQLRSAAERSVTEGLIQGLETDAQRARLERQLSQVSIDQGQRVFAPQDGKVLRIAVATGAVVAAGQPLLALAADDEDWEAWLYVSAHEAGSLHSGQEIELKLDAYPHQIFGTINAVVFSVTRLAIAPREVRVPVNLSGAVFEVRAKIRGSVASALSTDTLPGIGAAISADIVRQRYRLYQWLLRSRSTLAGSERA